MKATIEIPDDLYRQVKAKSALEGHTIREVTIDLYEHWLEKPKTRASKQSTSIPSWYGSLHKYAKNAKSHDMESIRESIRKGRLKEEFG
jgi:hypothetical protein